MKHYVVGFAFCGTRVLLVKKLQPEWQKNKYNGVGGKIDEGENLPITAMNREFKEETGVEVFWTHTVTLIVPGGGTLHCFRAFIEEEQLNAIPMKNDAGELLEVFKVNDLPADMMYNLFWLIPLQLAQIDWPLLIQEHVSVMKEVT